MPMLSMKTKKPTKPMLEILEITDDAGRGVLLSSPSTRPDHARLSYAPAYSDYAICPLRLTVQWPV